MIKYMLVRTNMIWKNIKYQIERTYKKTKNNENFDLNYINSEYTINCDQYKILKIKDNGYCFKILGEINYSEIIPNRNTFKMIAAIKNKDEKILEEFVESDDDKLQIVVINAGVDKYLDILIETKGIFWASDIIKKYGRNKDLDYFIENTNDFFTLSCIANVGRNKDLDKLMNSTSNLRVIRVVLSNGRKKDLEKYIKNPTQEIKEGIFEAGIDKYLDLLEKTNEDSQTFIERTKSIRKKDLDGYLKLNNHNFLRGIIKHGFDEHLDVIIKKELHFTFEYILKFKRQKDIEFLMKKGYDISYYI